MVPMLDPMAPTQPMLLLAITPAFVGVVAALLAALALAIAGTMRELERGGAPSHRRAATRLRQGVDAARARA